MKCPNCQNEIPDDALFCGNCGTKIEKKVESRVENRKKNNQTKNKKNIIIAGVIAIFIIIALAIYFIFFNKSESVDGIYVLTTIKKDDKTYTESELSKYTQNKMITLELDDGKAMISTNQEEGTYEIDGSKITITINNYSVNGTIEDNKIILKEDNNELIFEKTDKTNVSIKDNEDEEETIELEKESLTVAVGDIVYIEANIDCTYSVKDKSICSVDSFGTVKGLKAGSTTVTCTADNKTKATCKITVKEKENEIEIESYEASSTLLAENYDYSVKNVFDQNCNTCWVEGAEDDGLGQSITVHFKNKVKINHLFIVNGISKTNELYLKNNRLKQAILTFDDGNQEIINIEDIYNQKQEISFATHETQSVTISIKEVYRGSKYQDTCISELGYSYQ